MPSPRNLRLTLCVSYVNIFRRGDGVKKSKQAQLNIKDCILISLFSAIIAVSSLIHIPSPVPLTLQTLAIFCALVILGGKKGTVAIILYIFLGIIGLPVFSGFSGGVGHLLGATGGYVFGFVLTGIIFQIATFKNKNSTKRQIIGLAAGLLSCYLVGTLWYAAVYIGDITLQTIASATVVCVLPFVIPDAIKLIAAILIGKKLKNLTEKTSASL